VESDQNEVRQDRDDNHEVIGDHEAEAKNPIDTVGQNLKAAVGVKNYFWSPEFTLRIGTPTRDP